MRTSIQDLIQDLARHEDRQPEEPEKKGNADVPTIAEQDLPAPGDVPEILNPATLRSPWNEPGTVACIAGRGPLDDTAAAILAQMLEKHGLGDAA